MSQVTNLYRLSFTVAALSATSLTYAAGLDRSGQDITAFLQDGTYAEVVYTYIDANVSGYDNAIATGSTNYIQGNAFDDIVEPYDFVRYGVKADVNDTFSVGVLYDQPFGAKAGYTGDNNFTGNVASENILKATRGKAIVQASQSIKELEQQEAQATGVEKVVYNNALDSLRKSEAAFQGLPENPSADQIGAIIKAGEAAVNSSKTLASALPGNAKQVAEQLITKNEAALKELSLAKQAAVNAGIKEAAKGNTDRETKVDVNTQTLSLIGGVKLGADKRIQVYGGPVLQRAQADIKLRGDAYGPATGYNAYVTPSDALGWLAGASYSIPEIALKAAVTYRSGIEHKANISEELPVAASFPESNGATTSRHEAVVTTPQSVNINFQTGLSAKHQLLGIVNARWVPWSDFAIRPPLYNAVTKKDPRFTKDFPDGLNLVDYSEDQWQVDVGIGKRINPKLAVSGVVGWDSGAGNPVTSLGPIDGYWSVGGGAKYNITDEWAVSAGGKYLLFRDAKGALPYGAIVNSGEKNTGFAAGVQLSYQSKQ